jgi:hypothetical protein
MASFFAAGEGFTLRAAMFFFAQATKAHLVAVGFWAALRHFSPEKISPIAREKSSVNQESLVSN